MVVQDVLVKLLGIDSILRTEYGFSVRTMLEGESAARLNSAILFALRGVEKQTTLQAQWVCDSETEQFIDFPDKP